MSENWNLLPLLGLGKGVENSDTSIGRSEELKNLFLISKKLFKVLLIWNQEKSSIESIRNICRTINKFMGLHDLFGNIERAGIESSYWPKLIQAFRADSQLIGQNRSTYNGLPITFEMAYVNILNQLIHIHSANGAFIKEAIELTFNLVTKYINIVEVSTFDTLLVH